MVGPDEWKSEPGIAVVDSLYEPGDRFRGINSVGRQIQPEWLPCKELDGGAEGANPHGFGVLDVLTRLISGTTYHFFQATDSGGVVRDRDLIHALSRIREFSDEIEVVNISIGLNHITNDFVDCDTQGPKCAVCDLVNDLIDEGIVVIAGAGNSPGSNNLGCPSLAQDAISVGGAIPYCRASVNGQSVQLRETVKPPNALWVESPEESDDVFGEAYCSNRGCMPGASCSSNRELALWDNTPVIDSRKPDVLAPPVHIIETEERIIFANGTSYSTPIVTAQVANVIRGLSDEGISPPPPQIRAVISQTTTSVPDCDFGLLNGHRFMQQMADAYNLSWRKKEDRDTLFRP